MENKKPIVIVVDPSTCKITVDPGSYPIQDPYLYLQHLPKTASIYGVKIAKKDIDYGKNT